MQNQLCVKGAFATRAVARLRDSAAERVAVARMEVEDYLSLAEGAGLVRTESAGCGVLRTFEMIRQPSESEGRLEAAIREANGAYELLSSVAAFQAEWPGREVVLELRGEAPACGGKLQPATAASVLVGAVASEARESLFSWFQETTAARDEIRFVHTDPVGIPRIGFFLRTTPARRISEAIGIGAYDTLQYFRERENWERFGVEVAGPNGAHNFLERVDAAALAALAICAAASERSIPDLDLDWRVYEAAERLYGVSTGASVQEPTVQSVEEFLSDLATYEKRILGRDWCNPDRSALGRGAVPPAAADVTADLCAT